MTDCLQLIGNECNLLKGNKLPLFKNKKNYSLPSDVTIMIANFSYHGELEFSDISFSTVASNKLFSENKNKLLSFLTLEKKWDGYNGAKFNRKTIMNTIFLLNKFDHQPEVFPISDGRIQLEFEKKCGDYLELTIPKKFNSKIDIFMIIKGKESEKIISKNKINSFINKFYDKN